MTMEVLLQELIVIGASFNVTTLPASEAPKPVPEMTTWLPTEPVVAERPVMTGAGMEDVLIDTPSKVAVASDAAFRLLT